MLRLAAHSVRTAVISAADLKAICPYTPTATLERFAQPLHAAMQEFEINNVARETMFLAQLAHESGGFRYVKELASGDDYEGRADLGNTESGDGVRYKGRGLIQITGRANYEECGRALGLDLLGEPALLEQPDNAARSAAWFWQSRDLNQIADLGDFKKITKRINGGLNGWLDRLAYLEKAQQVLA